MKTVKKTSISRFKFRLFGMIVVMLASAELQVWIDKATEKLRMQELLAKEA